MKQKTIAVLWHTALNEEMHCLASQTLPSSAFFNFITDVILNGGDEENSVCFAFCCSYDRICVRCPYDRPSAYKTVHRTVLLYGVSLRSSILCIKKQHIPLVCTALLVEMSCNHSFSRHFYIGFTCHPGCWNRDGKHILKATQPMVT